MVREELNIVLDWAAVEGWNPGLHDADAFYVTDPNGFFMGLLDNKPVSCISAVAYNESFGFLGFYIVKPEYRGRGYGFQIWNKAIEYLKTQNIGLDGVVTQQENYKKSGFKLAYRNIRYQGKSKKSNYSDTHIVKLSQVSFGDLLKYDDQFFPASRPQFLKDWINLPETMSFGYQQNKKLSGYGVIRKCKIGYKIGPLFANNKEIAEKLFTAMNNFLESGSIVFLDTPEINSAALELAKSHRMKMCFETARMYTKEKPSLPLNKIFGVTTFELG